MKKNIFLLALLIAIVSGAYIGVNEYMKVNATKAYVDLLLCEAIDQLATIDYRSNPTQGNLLEKFNVPIDYIQKESSLVQSKFN